MDTSEEAGKRRGQWTLMLLLVHPGPRRRKKKLHHLRRRCQVRDQGLYPRMSLEGERRGRRSEKLRTGQLQRSTWSTCRGWGWGKHLSLKCPRRLGLRWMSDFTSRCVRSVMVLLTTLQPFRSGHKIIFHCEKRERGLVSWQLFAALYIVLVSRHCFRSSTEMQMPSARLMQQWSCISFLIHYLGITLLLGDAIDICVNFILCVTNTNEAWTQFHTATL